jgi:hypothetical protein
MDAGFSMRRAVVGLLLLLLLSSDAGADPAPEAWLVMRVSGAVWITVPGSDVPAPALLRMKLAGCVVLSTEANGRAVLARGSQAMVVGPGTTVEACEGGGGTLINGGRWIGEDERNGVIRARVEREPTFPLEVGVSMLATMVKG